jgi:hypothetical protein
MRIDNERHAYLAHDRRESGRDRRLRDRLARSRPEPRRASEGDARGADVGGERDPEAYAAPHARFS